MTTNTTLCSDTGCTSRCLDDCGIGRCKIQRAHTTRNMNARYFPSVDLCSRCSGIFLLDGLDSQDHCHCCAILEKYGIPESVPHDQ